jgi:stearoyl-CoA desaturase (delta-9 desaturase)
MNAPLMPEAVVDAPIEETAIPAAEATPSVQQPKPGFLRHLMLTVCRWFDNHSGVNELDVSGPPHVDWVRIIPFIAIHVCCLGVIWVGWSWSAVSVAIALYVVRMFAITGFYHRYFSHRSFSTSRPLQFLFAFIGNSSAQRGPLWWAAHHRHHHRHSDQEDDRHSPRRQGLIWSHMGWFSAQANYRTDIKLVPDLAKFPELRFLDRFDILAPLSLALMCFVLGRVLNAFWPELGTSGLQMWVWGFCISTVAVCHATFTVNSLTHVFGTQPYPSGDDSRNSLLIALVTFGEGWHNNHHYYQSSVRQGFRWWQIDMTFYALWTMSCLGLVWGLKPIPKKLVVHGGSPPA